MTFDRRSTQKYNKKGVMVISDLDNYPGFQEVMYEASAVEHATGPSRVFQKLSVILLTTRGTDKLNPTFGTNLNQVARSNMYDLNLTKVKVRREVKDGIQQFFDIQRKDTHTSADDIIDAIEIESIDIDAKNKIIIVLSVLPRNGKIQYFTL